MSVNHSRKTPRRRSPLPTRGPDLNGLGYYFDDRGTLRQTKNNEKFVWRGGQFYKILAQAVSNHIKRLLLGYTREIRTEQGVPIYVSKMDAKKILVIIQGSGIAEPGMWGSKLCINEDQGLDKGSMLPYLKMARADNYGVIILNPNFVLPPSRSAKGRRSPSDSGVSAPMDDENKVGHRHVRQAWEEIILPLHKKGAKIDVVAHSAGAFHLVYVLGKGDYLAKSVRRVAFTDGYHDTEQVEELSPFALSVFHRVINYACSNAPFGQFVESWESCEEMRYASECGCTCISAETSDHTMTNYAAMTDIFKWFRERQNRKTRIPRLAVVNYI